MVISSGNMIHCQYLDALLGVVGVLLALGLPREELDEREHEATLLLAAQRHPEQ